MKKIKLNAKMLFLIKRHINGEQCEALLSEEMEIICGMMKRADYKMDDSSICIVSDQIRENFLVTFGLFKKILLIRDLEAITNLCIYSQFKPKAVIFTKDSQKALERKRNLGITESKPKEIVVDEHKK